MRISLSKNTFSLNYHGFQSTALAKYSVDFEDPIQWPPGSPQFRRDIALRLWGFDISQTLLPFTSIDLEAYVRYQTQQADLFMHDTGQHVLIRTHQHVSDITEILRENLDRSQAQEKVRLKNYQNKSHDQDNKALNASLNLAVRLMLMVEIGGVPNGFSGNAPLLWEEGKLSHVLAKHFAPPLTRSQEHVRLGKVFTARNIERIAGIKIRWTGNLADHLRLFDSDDDEMVVNIFHHASFLVMQRKR